jgi:hypothetical protein
LLGAFALVISVSFGDSALAVEGGLGRPISGMQISPYAGVVPPEPGLAVAGGETYYEGSIGGGLSVPIAGLLVANVDMKAAFTPISLLYIWPTPTKTWNFGSVASFPMAWLEVEANLSLGPFSVRKKDSTFGLFDLAFTPIIASHHFSQTDHLAFDFTFWAPTGGFVESWIQQVMDDEGAPAVLNGFVGRAFGIGPIITYSTKIGKSHLDFNARWIHDFDVTKRVEGDGFNFTANLKF